MNILGGLRFKNHIKQVWVAWHFNFIIKMQKMSSSDQFDFMINISTLFVTFQLYSQHFNLIHNISTLFTFQLNSQHFNFIHISTLFTTFQLYSQHFNFIHNISTLFTFLLYSLFNYIRKVHLAPLVCIPHVWPSLCCALDNVLNSTWSTELSKSTWSCSSYVIKLSVTQFSAPPLLNRLDWGRGQPIKRLWLAPVRVTQRSSRRWLVGVVPPLLNFTLVLEDSGPTLEQL